MTLNPASNEIVIARDDGIYTYGPQGKAGPYAYEGAKKLVNVSKDYVLIASPPNSNLSRSVPLRAFGGTQAEDIFNTSSFTILDTELKFIAHSESLSSGSQYAFQYMGRHLPTHD